jgi:hypothetical protein
MSEKSEEEIEKTFISYKRQLIKKLGSDALYDDEISNVAKKLIGSKFKGVFSSNKMKFNPGYYVINTGNSKCGGIHWVGIYITPKVVYVYDSYARHTNSILKKLEAQAKKHKKIVVESDRTDLEQQDDTSICGQLSLAWILCVKKHGIRNALKI